MKHMFLEKFFLASKTAIIRKKIYGIRQHSGETLHEYWERFNKMCATCPHHQINANDSKAPDLQYGKQYTIVWGQSSQSTTNADQVDIIGEAACFGQHQPNIPARVCGICTSVEHPIDLCPTLQETESDQPKSVGAIGGYQYGKQPYQSRPFDNQQFGKQPFRPRPSQGPYAAQRFESTPNVPQRPTSYQQSTPQYQASPFQQQQQRRMPPQGCSPSLEDLMKQLATTKHEFQQYAIPIEYECTIQDLKMQIGQLANTSVGSNNLPSQTIPNPRWNASALTLRSGKGLPQLALQKLLRSTEADSEPNTSSQILQQDKVVPLPFPTRTFSTRKPESDEKLLKIFCKVEINIPLLDAIKQIPKYAKFLKELCVHKRKIMKGSVKVGGIVLALTKNEEFTARA
ncbi:hypothetical protein CR513_02640, partial [Mucuna pruriens]